MTATERNRRTDRASSADRKASATSRSRCCSRRSRRRSLISAYKRNFGAEANAIVAIDRKPATTRSITAASSSTKSSDPKLEISKKEAGAKYEPGDFYDEEVTPKDFGRIAAQTAKQVIVQRIREAERDTVYNTYFRKLHDIVMGTVQRYEQRNMYVAARTTRTKRCCRSPNKCRAKIPDQRPIRAYVLDVRKTTKGPLVVLSRAAEGLVQRLLEFQVPEIQDDIVEIMAIAREAGQPHEGRGPLEPARGRSGRRVPRTEVEPHRQRLGRAARREDRRHSLVAGSGDVHHNALAPAKVTRRRALRGRRRRARDRARLPALAGDRTRRAERTAGRAASPAGGSTSPAIRRRTKRALATWPSASGTVEPRRGSRRARKVSRPKT